jgi:hypothetical protein
VDKGCHRDVEETLGVPRQEKSRGDEEFAKGGIESGARCFSSWQAENWRGGGSGSVGWLVAMWCTGKGSGCRHRPGSNGAGRRRCAA